MPDAVSNDVLISNHFMVEVGPISGYFMEVSGLGSETDVVESKLMGSNNVEVVRKQPGRLKWGDITLKRGITSNFDMWKWRKQVESGDVAGARADGSIVMLDQTGTEIARWNFEKAWPSKVSGPSVKSDASEVAVEELTIVCEYIERVS